MAKPAKPAPRSKLRPKPKPHANQPAQHLKVTKNPRYAQQKQASHAAHRATQKKVQAHSNPKVSLPGYGAKSNKAFQALYHRAPQSGSAPDPAKQAQYQRINRLGHAAGAQAIQQLYPTAPTHKPPKPAPPVHGKAAPSASPNPLQPLNDALRGAARYAVNSLNGVGKALNGQDNLKHNLQGDRRIVEQLFTPTQAPAKLAHKAQHLQSLAQNLVKDPVKTLGGQLQHNVKSAQAFGASFNAQSAKINQQTQDNKNKLLNPAAWAQAGKDMVFHEDQVIHTNVNNLVKYLGNAAQAGSHILSGHGSGADFANVLKVVQDQYGAGGAKGLGKAGAAERAEPGAGSGKGPGGHGTDNAHGGGTVTTVGKGSGTRPSLLKGHVARTVNQVQHQVQKHVADPLTEQLYRKGLLQPKVAHELGAQQQASIDAFNRLEHSGSSTLAKTSRLDPVKQQFAKIGHQLKKGSGLPTSKYIQREVQTAPGRQSTQTTVQLQKPVPLQKQDSVSTPPAQSSTATAVPDAGLRKKIKRVLQGQQPQSTAAYIAQAQQEAPQARPASVQRAGDLAAAMGTGPQVATSAAVIPSVIPTPAAAVHVAPSGPAGQQVWSVPGLQVPQVVHAAGTALHAGLGTLPGAALHPAHFVPVPGAAEAARAFVALQAADPDAGLTEPERRRVMRQRAARVQHALTGGAALPRSWYGLSFDSIEHLSSAGQAPRYQRRDAHGKVSVGTYAELVERAQHERTQAIANRLAPVPLTVPGSVQAALQGLGIGEKQLHGNMAVDGFIGSLPHSLGPLKALLKQPQYRGAVGAFLGRGVLGSRQRLDALEHEVRHVATAEQRELLVKHGLHDHLGQWAQALDHQDHEAAAAANRTLEVMLRQARELAPDDTMDHSGMGVLDTNGIRAKLDHPGISGAAELGGEAGTAGGRQPHAGDAAASAAPSDHEVAETLDRIASSVVGASGESLASIFDTPAAQIVIKRQQEYLRAHPEQLLNSPIYVINPEFAASEKLHIRKPKADVIADIKEGRMLFDFSQPLRPLNPWLPQEKMASSPMGLMVETADGKSLTGAKPISIENLDDWFEERIINRHSVDMAKAELRELLTGMGRSAKLVIMHDEGHGFEVPLSTQEFAGLYFDAYENSGKLKSALNAMQRGTVREQMQKLAEEFRTVNPEDAKKAIIAVVEHDFPNLKQLRRQTLDAKRQKFWVRKSTLGDAFLKVRGRLPPELMDSQHTKTRESQEHPTAMGSIVARILLNNKFGATNAKILPISVDKTSGSILGFQRAMEYLLALKQKGVNIKVINLSISDRWNRALQSVLWFQSMLADLHRAGISAYIAAGNDGTDMAGSVQPNKEVITHLVQALLKGSNEFKVIDTKDARDVRKFLSKAVEPEDMADWTSSSSVPVITKTDQGQINGLLRLSFPKEDDDGGDRVPDILSNAQGKVSRTSPSPDLRQLADDLIHDVIPSMLELPSEAGITLAPDYTTFQFPASIPGLKAHIIGAADKGVRAPYSNYGKNVKYTAGKQLVLSPDGLKTWGGTSNSSAFASAHAAVAHATLDNAGISISPDAYDQVLEYNTNKVNGLPIFDFDTLQDQMAVMHAALAQHSGRVNPVILEDSKFIELYEKAKQAEVSKNAPLHGKNVPKALPSATGRSVDAPPLSFPIYVVDADGTLKPGGVWSHGRIQTDTLSRSQGLQDGSAVPDVGVRLDDMPASLRNSDSTNPPVGSRVIKSATDFTLDHSKPTESAAALKKVATPAIISYLEKKGSAAHKTFIIPDDTGNEAVSGELLKDIAEAYAKAYFDGSSSLDDILKTPAGKVFLDQQQRYLKSHPLQLLQYHVLFVNPELMKIAGPSMPYGLPDAKKAGFISDVQTALQTGQIQFDYSLPKKQAVPRVGFIIRTPDGKSLTGNKPIPLKNLEHLFKEKLIKFGSVSEAQDDLQEFLTRAGPGVALVAMQDKWSATMSTPVPSDLFIDKFLEQHTPELEQHFLFDPEAHQSMRAQMRALAKSFHLAKGETDKPVIAILDQGLPDRSVKVPSPVGDQMLDTKLLHPSGELPLELTEDPSDEYLGEHSTVISRSYGMMLNEQNVSEDIKLLPFRINSGSLSDAKSSLLRVMTYLSELKRLYDAGEGGANIKALSMSMALKMPEDDPEAKKRFALDFRQLTKDLSGGGVDIYISAGNAAENISAPLLFDFKHAIQQILAKQKEKFKILDYWNDPDISSEFVGNLSRVSNKPMEDWIPWLGSDKYKFLVGAVDGKKINGALALEIDPPVGINAENIVSLHDDEKTGSRQRTKLRRLAVELNDTFQALIANEPLDPRLAQVKLKPDFTTSNFDWPTAIVSNEENAHIAGAANGLGERQPHSNYGEGVEYVVPSLIIGSSGIATNLMTSLANVVFAAADVIAWTKLERAGIPINSRIIRKIRQENTRMVNGLKIFDPKAMQRQIDNLVALINDPKALLMTNADDLRHPLLDENKFMQLYRKAKRGAAAGKVPNSSANGFAAIDGVSRGNLQQGNVLTFKDYLGELNAGGPPASKRKKSDNASLAAAAKHTQPV